MRVEGLGLRLGDLRVWRLGRLGLLRGALHRVLKRFVLLCGRSKGVSRRFSRVEGFKVLEFKC